MNNVTINETYFFREKDQFEVLVNKILPELHESLPASKTIRILSSPCSSGEEAYSIVLHIVEEAKIVQQRDIEVVGIDIDSLVIQKAKKANYSQRSVHAIDKNILNKWFDKNDENYELGRELQGSVDFQVVNVFDKDKMRSLGKFDGAVEYFVSCSR
jgi:chemotaxis protein methyltransferase CheR